MEPFKHITFFLSFIFFCQFSYSQDSTQFVGGLNRYDKIPPEKLEKANLRVWYEFSHPVKKNKESVQVKDTMTLVMGNDYSIYYDWNRELKYRKMSGQLDAVKKTIASICYAPYNSFLEESTRDERLSTFSLNRENSEIVKDRRRQMIITTDMDDSDIRSDKYYLLEEQIAPQGWQMHDDTMEIMGHTCLRASCGFRGRDYTAWFTMEIPVDDGPYKFYGLPGLILFVEDSEKQFQFRAIGMERQTNVVIVSENKKQFVKCTAEQYEKIKKGMRETVFMYYPKGSTLYMTKRNIPVEYLPLELSNE